MKKYETDPAKVTGKAGDEMMMMMIRGIYQHYTARAMSLMPQ